jgi:type IV pilus assembly protein PilA
MRGALNLDAGKALPSWHVPCTTREPVSSTHDSSTSRERARLCRTVRARAGRALGFTLIELMIVVAMIGVLSALAIAGYRKYIHGSQSTEALAMLQNIRAAQEGYKTEALSYLAVSGSDGTGLVGTQLYPRVQAALNDQKAAWVNSTGNDFALWQLLNVSSDGPVRFGYAVVANLPGEALPTGTIAGAQDPLWANAFDSGLPTEPWFVALAMGDRDDDNTTFAVFQTASFHNEVLVHEDTE